MTSALSQAAPSPVLYARLAAVCERLAATAGKLEKRRLIVEYLRSLDLENAARAALYLSGTPFAGTDPRVLNLGGALLTRVVRELTGADAKAMHAAYLRHGDLGSAASDLLGGIQPQLPLPQWTLDDLENAFAAIAAAAKPAAKERLAREFLERATPIEAKYWIKIVLGDMRTGVKESLVEEAIAAAYGAEIVGVRRAMTLTGNLAEVLALAGRRQLEEAQMRLFHPLGFMLASPVESVVEALKRFSPGALPEPEMETPEAQIAQIVAQIEDKYDGVRAQVHCGDPEQPGRVALFSRSREDITASFPEIVEAFEKFPEEAILDGEILAWSPGGEDAEPDAGRALPFAALQPRLGRKRVTAAMRGGAPVVFMAFDLLYAAGELMLDHPLVERRRALEELVRRRQPETRVGRPSSPHFLAGQGNLSFGREAGASPDLFARLVLAPAAGLRSASQLEQAYLDARARGNEGVMLKALQSTYQPGRRGLSWLKLKRELATLDVVVTAVEYGHGRRAGTLSDYTFSIRDGGALKVVGKAYSGLTDAEIARFTEFFRKHTLEDLGSTRLVEPLLVLEVAFNNVMRSDRHDSGFALRFPRIVRVREDKPVSEIDTLARVEEIYLSQQDGQS